MKSLRIRRSIGAASLAVAVLALCSWRAPLSAHASGLHVQEDVERDVAISFELFSPAEEAMRSAVVEIARAQVGRRYKFGGVSPQTGFDCSGLVRYVYSQTLVRTPRLAAQQATLGTAIQRDNLRPGDLLTFGPADTVTHIGIYVGDGKFVHASSVAGRVIVSPVERPPARRIVPIKGARRIWTNS